MERNPKIVGFLTANPKPDITSFEEAGDHYVVTINDKGVPVRFRFSKRRPREPESHLHETPFGDVRGTYYRWHKDLSLQDVAERWHEHGAKVRDDEQSSFELPSGELFQAFYPVYELWHHREDDRPYQESLAETLKEKGWLSPIQVSFGRQDGNILIGEGNHRLRVARELGLRYVPVRFFFQQHVEKPTPMSRLRRKENYEAAQMGESRKEARKHDLSSYEKRGLKFNPRPSHHRLRSLIPNAASLSFRDRDELLRRVRELDALEERAMRAYERGDFHLAERIDAEYAHRADELEGLAAELMEDLVEDDVEPGEWDKHPMGRGHVPGPEGATDLNAELAMLYEEYLTDRSPHSRFEAAEHFRNTPFPVETREDVLAYLTLHTIEAAHGRPVDVVDKTLLIEAAKDAHERRAELRSRMKVNPVRLKTRLGRALQSEGHSASEVVSSFFTSGDRADPLDEIATNLNLDTVRWEWVEETAREIREVTRSSLIAKGFPSDLEVWRCGQADFGGAEVTSVTTDRHAAVLGCRGGYYGGADAQVRGYCVKRGAVLADIDAVLFSDLYEQELLVRPADLRPLEDHTMNRNPSADIDEVFDEAFDRIEDTFPDVGTIEFWEDDAAGADNGAGADRQFAYCKNGNPIAIAFAPKATQLSREQLVGLMRHEFGHAMEYRFGVAELERRLGVRLPASVERRADAIAEAIWREPIVYDERLIQCVGTHGVRPRPSHLPDERAVLRPNTGGWASGPIDIDAEERVADASGLLWNPDAKRCTQLTLQAFGIDDPEWTERCVRDGMEVMSILGENGWRWQPVYVEGRPTVARFIKDHPSGRFVLSSRGHSMAVVDGELWDLSGGSKRHRVLSAQEVFRPGDPTVYDPFSTYRPTMTGNPARRDGRVQISERDDQYVVFDWIPDDAPPDYEGVAQGEDGIGAFMTAEFVESEEEPYKRFMVDYIEVDYPYRRSGAATRLYEEAMAYARRHGATLVSDSRRSLGADMFWQKMAKAGVAELRGEDPVKRWDGEVLDYRVTYYVMKPDAPEVLP